MFKRLASDIKRTACALCNIGETRHNLNTRDLLFFFNEIHADAYYRLGRKEPGFYAVRERIDRLADAYTDPIQRDTLSLDLPDYMSEVLLVYEAHHEFDANRTEYRQSNGLNRGMRGMYSLEGRRLLITPPTHGVPVWIEYLPEPAAITWPILNSDPEILDEADVPAQPDERLIGYIEVTEGLVFRDIRPGGGTVDMRVFFERDDWEYANHMVSEPYLIVNLKNRHRDTWRIMIYQSLTTAAAPVTADVWNAFDWRGRGTNCECLYARHDNHTLGDMIVRDHADGGRIKKLGFFPDTELSYPSIVMADLLTWRLADRIAKLCGMDSPLIADGLFEAMDRFDNHVKINRAGFRQITPSRRYSPWM